MNGLSGVSGRPGYLGPSVRTLLLLLSMSVFFVSKLIPDCFGFGLPQSAIGPKKWRQLFNQIAPEVEPITNRLIVYSRASGSLLDFALSSHWLLMIFFFVVIGC